jgi:magnesium chelatase subunit I
MRQSSCSSGRATPRKANCARIVTARKALKELDTPDATLRACAALCIALGSDGLGGELTLLRAGRALAAYEGAGTVTVQHVKSIAASARRHRLRRDPLDEAGSSVRVGRVVEEVLG